MLKTLLHRIVPLLVLGGLAPIASAQFSVGGVQQQQGPRATAELILYEAELAPGMAGTLGVLITMQETWKIQAGKGSGDEIPPYIPTEITLTVPDGWVAGTPLWPEAKTFTFEWDDEVETLSVYEDRALVIVPVIVPEDAQPGEYAISARVRYQACDPNRCEIPTNTTADVAIDVVEAVSDEFQRNADVDDEMAELFARVLERNELSTSAEGVDDERDAAVSETDATAPSHAERASPAAPSFFGLQLPSTDGTFGLLLVALLAAIGGFILNLTPCVLPVIPIKIMTIIQHANHPGKNLVLGLWMFLGVVMFWVALGLPVAFVAGITDPSRIFGIWWLTFGIGVVIALMAVGVMGMFTIQLPNAVYAINPKADTAWGSFFFGVMTGVLGLPCFGFVAGALLVGAATMPASHVMTIFASLGVGMALPYLVLSLKPSWVQRIPRTGPASELVKQVMGLLLLAASAYFIGAGLIALVRGMPYIGTQLHWWAVAVFAVMASVWLIVRTVQITPSFGVRLTSFVTGLILGGVALAYAVDSTGKAREDWHTYQAAIAEAGGLGAGYVHGVWNRWTPAAFERAREDGHILVLDFTAEWCLNCKVLKATVLDRNPVRAAISDRDVVKFTVDLTSDTDPGWTFMREALGQTGIPLLAIYTPGHDEPWQANAYTPQQVMAALEEARTNRVAQR